MNRRKAIGVLAAGVVSLALPFRTRCKTFNQLACDAHERSKKMRWDYDSPESYEAWARFYRENYAKRASEYLDRWEAAQWAMPERV